MTEYPIKSRMSKQKIKSSIIGYLQDFFGQMGRITWQFNQWSVRSNQFFTEMSQLATKET